MTTTETPTYEAEIVSPNAVRFWVHLVWDGSNLSLELLSDSSEWSEHPVAYEIGEMGLEHLLCRDSTYTKIGELEFQTGLAGWAMRNFLVPEQPFQVEVYCHHYVSHTMDGDEGDCEIRTEILRREDRVDPLAFVDTWAAWATSLRTEAEAENRTYRAVYEAQRTPGAHLYINQTWFYGDGYYDEMSPPNALRLTLCSVAARPDGMHGRAPNMCLVCGESRNGDFKEALSNLAKAVAERVPTLKDINLSSLYQTSYHLQPGSKIPT